MKEFLQYAFEAIVSTGLLYGCYRLLLDRRVDYGICRLYLFAALVAGSLIPLFDIPVWPGRVVEVAPLPSLPQPELPTVAGAPAARFDERAIVWLLCGLGTAVLLGMMARQAVQIVRLHRGAVVSRCGAYRLVRTLRRISSFSFLRSIYLWRHTPEEELSAIIAHEASHIAHHHTIERLAVELLKALLWWNPVVWLAARALAEVEEFEADHDVLRAGFRRDTYMATIYRQLAGYSPDIANGLPHSLTKKRFEMMTTQIRKKGTLLRLAAVVPVMAGLVCAFSFTARATEYRTVGVAAAAASAVVDPAEESLVPFLVFVRAEGKPLSGALVTVPGTSLGTVTDGEGRATLRVPSGTTVEISYVGMKSRTCTVRYDAAESRDQALAVILSLDPERPTSAAAAAEPAAEEVRTTYLVDGRILSPEAFAALDPKRVASVNVIESDETRERIAVVTLTADASAENSVDQIVVTGFPVPDEEIAAPSAAPQPSVGKEGPYIVAEVMPTFEGGGLDRFRGWVNAQVRYPGAAFEKRISACRVVASFVVDRTGRLTQIRILESPDAVFGDEVIRVLSASPRWTPGEQQGEPVDVRYTLPVEFRLTELDSEPTPAAPAASEASAAPEAPVAAAADGEEEPSLVAADRMPSFRGGDLRTFRTWLMSQIRYPEELRKRRVEGKVLASFVIDRSGRVTDVRILQSPDRRLSEEVVQALRRSPRWEPCRQDGREVSVQYTLPVQFGMLR